MKEYVKAEIAEIIGKPPRTIQYWTDMGYVMPDIERGGGKGKARIYSHRNVIEFGILAVLSEETPLHLMSIHNILHDIREKGPKKGSGYVDFYTEPAWGVSKELIYGMVLDGSGMTLQIKSYVMGKDEDGRWVFAKSYLERLEEFIEKGTDTNFMTLSLGKVKLEAERRFRLK